MKTLALEIGADNYLIAGNGALIYNIKNDEIIYNKFMDKKKVLEILDICEKNSIFYNVYTEDTILAKTLEYNVMFYYYENFKKSDDKKTKIKVIPNLYEHIKNLENEKILKITLCENNKIVFNSILKKIREIKQVTALELGHMSRKIIKNGTEEVKVEYFYTEITNLNINKWTAIEHLMKELSIKKEEVMAIGDNVNDKEMIENAGLGVVMGNSAPYIQKLGNKIVKDNNSNGVAQAINEEFL